MRNNEKVSRNTPFNPPDHVRVVVGEDVVPGLSIFLTPDDELAVLRDYLKNPPQREQTYTSTRCDEGSRNSDKRTPGEMANSVCMSAEFDLQIPRVGRRAVAAIDVNTTVSRSNRNSKAIFCVRPVGTP